MVLMKSFLNKNFRFAPFTILLAAITAFHCAKAPDEKLETAREALGMAKTAGAEMYAGKDYSYAQELFAEACNEMEILKEKRFSLFFRKYADVNKKLDSVIIIANTTAELAATAKEWLQRQEMEEQQQE